MQPSQPLVSIGLPVYNGEKYLPRALTALIGQDYPNFELIIADNASTDGTNLICRDLAAADPRVRLHVNRENIGILGNFGLVLEKARGKYFMWAACDDFWTPDFVGKMVQALETHSEAGVAMSAVERIRENGERHDVVRYAGPRDPGRMSHFKLALALMVGRPYHLFFYGLHRTDFLKKAFRNFLAVAAGDRLFICQLALATGFRYVDEILHVRTISNEPIVRKYANEAFGRIWRRPLAGLETTRTLGPYLFGSQVIPSSRKLLIPLLAAIFTCRIIYRMLTDRLRLAAGLVLGLDRAKGVAQYMRQVCQRKPA